MWEIQILYSNWNPLRFQEKLSHFHSPPLFLSFQICKFHCISSFLSLLEKNTFFFDVQIWSTSSLTLCLLLLASFTLVQKLSMISSFLFFQKKICNLCFHKLQKKCLEKCVNTKVNKISNFCRRVSFSIMEKYLRDLIFFSQVNEG